MVKNIYVCIWLTFLSAQAFAQNQVEALRYSQSLPGSTARSSGSGGAFGAVGADFSSALINPAGLAFYRSKQFGIGTSFYNITNKADYITNSTTDNKFNFNIPNISFVNSYINYENGQEVKDGWVNVCYGITLNRTNNFHRQTLYEGNNNRSSITQNFAERGNGQDFNNFSPSSLEYLALQTKAIDFNTTDTNQYVSGFKSPALDINQTGSIRTRGAMNDYAFSIAGNYSHKIYIGGSLFISSVRYIEDNDFKETDNKPASSKDIKSISLNQYIKTNGTGLGARIGIIGKLNENIRIAYSFQSPVSHTLKDIYSYQIDATFDPGASYNSGPAVSPATSKSQQNNYSYRISTPSRNTLSIALLDKKIGFLSGDVEFVNYKQAKLSPVVQGDNFNDDNKLIKTIYKNAVNLRVGAEIISDIFRFRAG
ncbi:MAG: hypothetical protein H7321_00820, partial [Bacteroidia bacterium]|nr:hypothetical protein [Bacteroidia bacterium]